MKCLQKEHRGLLHHFISVSEKKAIFSSAYLPRRWKIKRGDVCLCLECCIWTAGRCFWGFLALCDALMWWNDRGTAGVIRHETLKLFAQFNSREMKFKRKEKKSTSDLLSEVMNQGFHVCTVTQNSPFLLLQYSVWPKSGSSLPYTSARSLYTGLCWQRSSWHSLALDWWPECGTVKC